MTHPKSVHSISLAVLLALSCWLAGCSGDAASSDGGSNAGGAGPKDASPPPDAGPADGALSDSAPADAAPGDVAATDTAPGDAQPADAGAPDANPVDAGPADTAPADAQPTDTQPGDGGPATAPGLAIAGVYANSFGGYEEITSALWNDTPIVEFDNNKRVVYTRNPADAKFSPGKFNKIVFTVPGGASFHYCFADFGLDSLEAAKASSKAVDESDPDKKGCGGFSWTKLTATDPIEIAGTWSSNFGGEEIIRSIRWGKASIKLFDNGSNTAYTQNPEDAPAGARKFSKLVWTEPVGGVFHYCTVDFNLDTLAAAQASAKTADPSNPEKGGCGGFSWTKLNRKN
ncbi:MAG: hypothetical protein GMKNLPBB_00728 [Myxococcota bacterium]|nr:hypothetical protein [Myxococcota bacterium]